MKVDIVTPQRHLISLVSVTDIGVPGIDGDFQVMSGHTPFMTQLRTGVVTLTDSAGSVRKLMVSGGYAEVDHDHVTIMTEEAAVPEDVNDAELRAELASLEAAVADMSSTAGDLRTAQTKLAQAQAKLDIV